MVAKFQLKDDESDLIIGEFKDLINLSGDTIAGDVENFTCKTKLIDFTVTDEFKKYCLQSKTYVNNVHLIILNLKGDAIGSYYFTIDEPMFSHKSIFLSGDKDIELVGTFLENPSVTALELWDEWRICPPIEKNKWAHLALSKRASWLEVARLHQEYKCDIETHDQKKVYELDGTYIEDSNSFFCALGEAIIGPGGYYGFNLSSLKDCLSGDFGIASPFSIVWKNFSFDTQNDISLNNINSVRMEPKFFYEVIELLTSYQLTVTFLPK